MASPSFNVGKVDSDWWRHSWDEPLFQGKKLIAQPESTYTVFHVAMRQYRRERDGMNEKYPQIDKINKLLETNSDLLTQKDLQELACEYHREYQDSKFKERIVIPQALKAELKVLFPAWMS